MKINPELLSVLERPGARTLALIVAAALIALGLIIHAYVTREPRYKTLGGTRGVILDTHTGKASHCSEAPPIWPERRK